MTNLLAMTIVSFRIIENYTLEITFKDGTVQVINFEPVIGKGWMVPLKQLDYFNQVILNDGGNLEWPEGQDFNPEALYNWPEFEQAYIDDMQNY